MNGAHLHLIVNHVSLFALIIGAVALAASMKRGSAELRLFATALFVVAGLFGWIGVETGEKAERVLRALDDGFKPFIHEHELAAAWAQRSGLLVAALAVVMEWAIRTGKRWSRTLQWVLLILAIHGCTVFARTAFLGGLIRHVEIRR